MHNGTLYKPNTTELQVSQQQAPFKILRQIRQRSKRVRRVIKHTHSVLETEQTI